MNEHSEHATALDPRALRDVFGTFLTGVTVVTTVDDAGRPWGFTANSFTSVSLDPPLVLFCMTRGAEGAPVFANGRGFAVNILGDWQREVSDVFASRVEDRFAQVGYRLSPGGSPLIEGALSWVDCARTQVVDGGDHLVIFGRVLGLHYAAGLPLGYYRGHYVKFGLGEDALEAAAPQHIVVGSIADDMGNLLLVREGEGWRLPAAPLSGKGGHRQALKQVLGRYGVDAGTSFLYSVIDAPDGQRTTLYFRADVTARQGVADNARFFASGDIPWDRLVVEPERSLLQRYVQERSRGNWGVYFDTDQGGQVAPVRGKSPG